MDDFSTGHLTSETLRRILMLLCEESGFLVDDKLDQLLTPLSKQEQRLIRLDAVFKVRSALEDKQSSRSGACTQNHPTAIVLWGGCCTRLDANVRSHLF
jgi:hypothetical protein